MCDGKLKSGVRRRPTFPLQLELPPLGNPEVAEGIRRKSRDSYAKKSALEIDKELQAVARRYKVFTGPGVPALQTVDADPFGDTTTPQNVRQGVLPVVATAAADEQSADGQEAGRHRKRGQGGKGGVPAKPQAAATPEGEALSTPMLFTPLRLEGDQEAREQQRENDGSAT